MRIWQLPDRVRLATYLPIVRVAAVLTIAVFGLSSFPRFFSDGVPQYQHLGAEYYSIARAIVSGRGFSDPFGEPTGPTAWMPPLFPCLLAGLLVVFETKALVASAVLFLTNMALVATGLILYRIAGRCRPRGSPLVCVAIYVGWLLVFYDSFFLVTHDVAFVGLLIAVLLWELSAQIGINSIRPLRWGLLGGVVALSSAPLLFAWSGLTMLIASRLTGQRRGALFSVLAAGLVAGPWVIRNALTFHTAAPKSNLYYEAYLSNYVDDDGIYDAATLVVHPYNSPIVRSEYARLGEAAFLHLQREKLIAALKQDPARYLRNIANRAFAATLHEVPFVAAQISPRQRLEEVVYALPFVTMLLSLAAHRWRRRPIVPGLSSAIRSPSPLLALLGCLYVLFLAPYVLVAFYLRYFLQLTPVLILLMLTALESIPLLLGRDRASAPVSG